MEETKEREREGRGEEGRLAGTCALLWKSPNWASQQTREFGLLAEKPRSNPSTANSLRELLHTVYLAWVGERVVSGLNAKRRKEGMINHLSLPSSLQSVCQMQ